MVSASGWSPLAPEGASRPRRGPGDSAHPGWASLPTRSSLDSLPGRPGRCAEPGEGAPGAGCRPHTSLPGQGQDKGGRTDRGAAVTDGPLHEARGVPVTARVPARSSPRRGGPTAPQVWCNDTTRRLTGCGRRNCHLLGTRGGFGRENKQLSIRSGPRKPEVPVRCPRRSAKRTATARPWRAALLCRRGQGGGQAGVRALPAPCPSTCPVSRDCGDSPQKKFYMEFIIQKKT